MEAGQLDVDDVSLEARRNGPCGPRVRMLPGLGADADDRIAPPESRRLRPPHQRRRVRNATASVAATVVVLALTSCSTGDAASDSTPPSFVAAFDCGGLADRWIRLQQSFLDRLGDATAAELDSGSDRVAAANRWLGGALIEQARDARAVGCEAELAAGAPALCSRLTALEPAGDAGSSVVADLRIACGSGN